MKLFYKNNISSLNKLASDIETYAQQNNILPAITYALNLCLDEVLTNIITYNLKNQSKDSLIEMELSNSNDQIIVTIRDNGHPFNPFNNPKSVPDIHSNLEERTIGGLGIYFLEQYMDKVEYKRENNQNVITLFKHTT